MSAPDATRFEELLSRHLDDCLEEVETDELLQSLSHEEFAARFLEMMKLDAEIAGLSAVPVPDAVMADLVLSDLKDEAGLHILHSVEQTEPIQRPMGNPLPSGIRKRSIPLLAWAAMIAVLLTVAGIYLSGRRSNPVAKVASVSGEVYFINSSGQVRATDGQVFGADQKMKTVGPESRATLVLIDGTRVDVGGNSTLLTENSRGKRQIYLEEGTIDSKIAKQSDTDRLTFSTVEAEVTVRGTAIRLKKWHLHTLLIVTEGEVVLKRPVDGSEITVGAGYHVMVEPNDPLKLVSNRRLARQHR
ncbi:MAG: FecR domain-containing protein [Akkermansiaceae bacterium]|nr:FecR domain-containing protein [Verrucomicrobiales bacterium]